MESSGASALGASHGGRELSDWQRSLAVRSEGLALEDRLFSRDFENSAAGEC